MYWSNKRSWQLGLLKRNFFSLVLFEFIYKLFGTFVFIPTIVFLVRRLILNDDSADIITLEHIHEAFSTPFNIIFMIVMILIILYYFLLEISIITTGLKYSNKDKTINIFSMIFLGAKKSLQFFKPINWLAFIIVIFFIPFLHMGITSGLTDFFYSIELLKLFSTETITINWNLIAIVYGLCIVFCIFFGFTFVFFSEYNTNIITSLWFDVNVYLKKFFRTLWSMIKLVLSILLGVVLGFLVLVMISFIIYEILFSNLGVFFGSVSTQTYREFVTMISPLVAFYFCVISVFLTLWFFSGVYGYLYYKADDKLKKITVGEKVLLYGFILILFVNFSLIQGNTINNSITNDMLLKAQTGGIITGHRGDMIDELENTASAFDNAISHGAEYVELDINRTKDGVLIVCHDSTLKGMTGKDLVIEETDYNTIRNLPLKQVHDYPNPDHILTLDEVIDYVGDRAKINIELKEQVNSDGFVQQVVDTVKNHNAQDNVFLASGVYDYVKQIEDIDSSLETLYLVEIFDGDIENIAADGLSVQFNAINQDLVNRVHLKGKMIHAWILEYDQHIEEMIDYNVDYLITNNVRMGQIALASHRPDQFKQLATIFQYLLIQS